MAKKLESPEKQIFLMNFSKCRINFNKTVGPIIKWKIKTIFNQFYVYFILLLYCVLQ